MSATHTAGGRKVSKFDVVFDSILRRRDFSAALVVSPHRRHRRRPSSSSCSEMSSNQATLGTFNREQRWRFAVQYQSATLGLLVSNSAFVVVSCLDALRSNSSSAQRRRRR